jgi:hypothetical protein
MWASDWQVQSHTLPYILTNTDRYSTPKGEFFIVLENSKIVGCSGIYFSDFNSQLALAGCRTWITKDYRNKLLSREILLPAQKKWAIDRNATAVGLTFNDYNNLIRLDEKNICYHIYFGSGDCGCCSFKREPSPQ